MLKLIIGNRTYSSWSLRGWLACKLSALDFETQVLPMDTPDWDSGLSKGRLPSGKVPVVWDGDLAVWDSLAIIDWLADRVRMARLSRGHFWPHDLEARGFARSIAAEMHSGFPALRSACPMNLKYDFPDFAPDDAVRADIARIDALWSHARTTWGMHADVAHDDFAHDGPFLFGAFGAADAMYAPVVTRIRTYGLPVSDLARAYVDAVAAHPWMAEWTADARAETFPFARHLIAGGVPTA